MNRAVMITLLPLILVLAGCGSSEPETYEYDETESGGVAYDDVDQGQDSFASTGLTFGGYPCTQDCSGHEAGYDWAAENGIDDPYDCGGNSQSFIEGCMVYAEENGY